MNRSYNFSVIIPTHNRSQFLVQAINSILAQQNVSVQIVVVDDASTDDTPQVVAQLQKDNPFITYIRNEKSAFAHGARSNGYKNAVGSYIIFMDDDDFYIDESFFSNAKCIFEEKPTVSAVIGSTVNFTDGNYNGMIDLHGEGLIDNKTYLNGFQENFPKPGSTLTAVFRKQSLDEINFAESKMVNDTCIYLNGILCGDVYLINKPVGAYRIHSANMSFQRKLPIDFIINTFEEKLKIYKQVKRSDKLNDKKNWLFTQLDISVEYFVRASLFEPATLLKIAFWLLIHGQGTQLKFFTTYLHRLFDKLPHLKHKLH